MSVQPNIVVFEDHPASTRDSVLSITTKKPERVFLIRSEDAHPLVKNLVDRPNRDRNGMTSNLARS